VRAEEGVRRSFLLGEQTDLDRVTLLEGTVRRKQLLPGTRSSRLLLMQWMQNETCPGTAGVSACVRGMCVNIEGRK